MTASIDVPLRRLVHQYVFDHRLSNCSSCSLVGRRDETFCPSARPDVFNGLMIVGEGPGPNESRIKQPFVGRSGNLLDKMLVEVGIDRSMTYITNASSCLPPMAGKEKDAALEIAIPACRPRLVAEIEHYHPRVIVALGGEALSSIAGYYETFTRQKPRFTNGEGAAINCPQCDGQMTLAWWKCPVNKKHVNLLPHSWDAACGKEIDGQFWCRECYETAGIQTLHARVAVQPRKKKCTTCEGRKTIKVEQQEWTCEHKISKVAGLLFRGREALDYKAMDPEARIDLPVHYVIPTWHPSFLLRQPDKKEQKKAPGGQFLLNAALDHLRKAKRLLTENAKWAYSYHVVPDHLVRDVAHLADTDPTKLLAHSQADATAIAQFREYVCGNFGQIATTIDLETDNKEPWSVTDIRCIGFHHVMTTDAATQAMPAFVVNTTGRKRGDPLIEEIVAWLANPAYTKSGQNGASYEVQVVWAIWKIDIEGYKLDTLVAHNVVRPDEPHDLQHIAGCYTDTPPWKPVKTKNDDLQWESSEQLHRYNGRDVYNTSLAIRQQLAELDREKTPSGRSSRFIHDLDVAMFHVARDMERGGMPVSRERWQRWEQRAEFYMNRDAKMISSLLGGRPIGKKEDLGDDAFNPNASAQVQWFLYAKDGPCRLTPTRYTETGQPSADKSALMIYKGHPAVDLLLDYRRWMHTKGTFMGGMSINAAWRLHVRWKPLGAVSGRWASSPNSQNWGKEFTLCTGLFEGITSEGRPYGGPHRLEMFPGDLEYLLDDDKTTVKIPGIRDVIKTPPGRKVVGADLSQAELRALGALSGDKKLISLCINADENRKLEPDRDPHSYGCSIAFKDGFLNADDKVKKRLRDLFKRVIYGSFYGAGADTILESIYDGGYEGAPIDIATVETILRAIFVAFPDVRPWREGMLREAHKTGKIWDALIGRRREFPMLLIDATVVYNYALQCCRSGTRVLTSDGYLPVERATHRASIGAPNQWSTSMTLGKRRERIWRTELENGQILETNEEHYLRVLREDRSGFDWKAVGELRPGESIAQPLAMPQTFGHDLMTQADAYWLGYYIGNGSWTVGGYKSVVDGSQKQEAVVWCFGDRVGRFAHEQYASAFTSWAQQYGGTWKPQIKNAMTSIGLAQDNKLRALLPTWGLNPEWRFDTKRVPESIWRGSLEVRKAFVLGYMDADGTLGTNQPSGHTPNLTLLRDLQVLARTTGVTSKIHGPYLADGVHLAWQWHLCGSLMRAHLDYGAPVQRQRFTREDRLANDARIRFLETHPKNPFSYVTERSFYVLWSRLAHGGTTNPHTLQRMYEAAGDVRDPSLYATGIVKSVTLLEVEDDLYTLAVEHENHCYDSAGIVSKNSTVGSMVALAMWELHKQLPSIDPTATILAQVHDAIYVECAEDKAHLVAHLLEQCMSGEYRFVEGADWMPFPATAKIADDWLEAG